MKRLLLLISLFTCIFAVSQTVKVSGKVVDTKGQPLTGATVKIEGSRIQALTNESGYFEVDLQPNTIYYFKITFQKQVYANDFKTEYTDLFLGTMTVLDKTFDVVDVSIDRNRDFFEGFPLVDISRLPSPTANFEDYIKNVGLGVASNNELTSNYNVRGGNYDENEVFVNGIQIYRPFLVRAGQQEGLSFIHSEFVQSIFFSGGGFDANYGDVLSSVLDVRYREAREFGGSAQASLMGGQVHIEDVFAGRRGNYIIGARYRANSYLLNSLPTQGDYNPTFFDVQGMTNFYLDYDNESSFKKIFFLGHFSSNNYRFIPTTRTTSWGTVNEAYQLRVFFEGQEETKFSTYTLASGYEWQVNKDLRMNWTGSVFHSIESEHFDVLGEYWINELETDPSKEEFGDSTSNVGVGGFLDHARNDLNVWIGSIAYDGNFTLDQKQLTQKNTLRFGEMSWGTRAQFEHFNDVLSEWHVIDSAGYSIPGGDPDVIELKDVIKQNNLVESYRFSGHYQYTQNFVRKKDVYLDLKRTIKTDSTKYVITMQDSLRNSPAKLSMTIGTRGGYRTYNDEYWVTPRMSLTYTPRIYFLDEDSSLIRRNVKYRFATGLYYQPPLYRTMRYLDGTINPDVVSQKSWHNVLAADFFFKMWGRDFKFVTEAYYKHMWDVVPYEIDNVRIRYYADNNAVAYAYGIDAKVNGQFVPGVESFFRVGYLKTMENIDDDDYYIYLNSDGDTIRQGYTFNDVAVDSIHQEPGWIPRPTDQLLNFTVFFQDKMPYFENAPAFENLKVSANLTIGTPLPYGPPSYERYKDILRTKSYIRLDLGFMYDFVNEQTKRKAIEKRRDPITHEINPLLPVNKFQKNFDQFTISLDAFNLLGIKNVLSYQWLQDISGNYYAIPNHLTGRRINLRVMIAF